MDDFTYDVMQKKRVAASARRRVNGCKSKRCGLPSDHMSPAEIRRMNGTVSTYKMSAPMTYAEFKNMPNDLQKQYLDGIISRFGVGIANISTDLFGKAKSTLLAHLHTKGITTMRGRKPSENDRKVWESWIAGEMQQDLPVVESVVEEEPVKAAPITTDLNVDRLEYTLTGELNANALCKVLAGMCVPEGVCKVHIIVERAEP